MRSFAIEEPGSPVPALYATLDDGDGDGDGGDCDGGDDDGGTSHWNAKRCRSDGRGTPFCQRAQLHSSQQGRE